VSTLIISWLSYDQGYTTGFNQGASAVSKGAELTLEALAKATKLEVGLDAHQDIVQRAAKILVTNGEVSPDILKELNDD
jgi:hypothetical protein